MSSLRRDSRIFSYRTAVLAIVAAVAAGCALMTPAPQDNTVVRYSLPELSPGLISETHGTVLIESEAVGFTAVKSVHKEYNVHPDAALLNNLFPSDVREVTTISVAPQRLQFKLRIHNNLGRELALDSVVASFAVGDKTVLVDKGEYADFRAKNVAPGEVFEYLLNGPDISALADKTAVTLTLAYVDVTDDRMALAGGRDVSVPLAERSSFAFHYQYALHPESEVVPVTVSQTQLTPAEVAVLVERVGKGVWGALPELDQK